MSILIGSDDLHVGRDPNDVSWRVVRHEADWAGAVSNGAYFDPLIGRVELSPRVAELADPRPLCDSSTLLSSLWLPLAGVETEEGTKYYSDPLNDRVLVQRACESAGRAIPCFGGRGFETGRLHLPMGVALDGRGLLFVADACNHRVQVVRPEDGSVAGVLGRFDAYGAAIAGTDAGAMLEPVDVAVDACNCRVYVADRLGGKIHVFNQRFQWVRSFEPRPDVGWPPGMKAVPVGVAVDDDGTILIADARWPRLLHTSADGALLPEVHLTPRLDRRFVGLRARVHYPASGEVVVGPIDGRAPDTRWHQVIVECDLPEGTSVEVQTYASETRTDLGRFARRQVAIAEFTNDVAEPATVGPSAGASTMNVTADVLAFLRKGDVLELDTKSPLPNERVTVTVLPAAKVKLRANGDRIVYGAGARVRLVARGALLPGGPRTIYTLGAGETVDLLNAAPLDPPTYTLPQAVAAFFRVGDRVEITNGAQTANVEIFDVAWTSSTITFAPALARDASKCTVRLATAPGRLIVESLTGYRLPADPGELITVAGPGVSGVATTPILPELDTGVLWVDPAPLGAGPVTWENWVRFDAAMATAWAPALPVAITGAEPSPEVDASDGPAYARLVLSDTTRWERASHGPYLRGRPVIAAWSGDLASPSSTGPDVNQTRMVVPVLAMPRLRRGDLVALDDGRRAVAPEEVRLGPLPPVTVTVSIASAGAAPFPVYAAGAVVRLLERDGRPTSGRGRVLRALEGAETIDLGAVASDGTSSPIACPHDAAAFFRSGDLIVLSDTVQETRLRIEEVSFAPAVALVPAGDAVLYAQNAKVIVRRRGGQLLPAPITLHRLGAGELIDLRPAIVGQRTSVAFPVAAAALLRRGDQLIVTDVVHTSTLDVVAVDPTSSVVALATPAGRSFVRGSAALVETPGRLVSADDGLPAFDTKVGLLETVRVFDDANVAVDATVLLAEADLSTLWVDPAALSGAVTFAAWRRFEAPADVATDRGRYIWVRLRLLGKKSHPGDDHSVETPSIRALRVSHQRPTLLASLPATFSRRDPRADASGALFLERFLALFEGQLTRIESKYESFSRLLNPSAAPSEWLDWLASWLDLVLDPSWPLEKRRTLVLRAMELYRRRGTRASIEDWVEIYAEERPAIVEGFRLERSRGVVLGQSATLGCVVLDDEASLSCDGEEQASFANRFWVYLPSEDPCRRDALEAVTRTIIDAMKPAHTAYELEMVEPDARLGVQSTIGLDFVLGDGQPPEPIALGQGTDPIHGGRFRPILGLDVRLSPEPFTRAQAAPTLGSDGLRVEAHFDLK